MYQDIAISTWVLENISQKNLWIGHIAKFLSNINSWGQMWLLIMLILIVYNTIKNKKFSFHYLIAIIPVIIGWCICEYWIKNLIARPRPYQEIEAFKEFMDAINYKYPKSYSFPSGHTTVSFAAAFVLASSNKKYIPYAYILASLIALSRIILGAHYLSDVIAGMGVGTIIGLLGILLSKFLSPKIDPIFNNFIEKKFKHEIR